MIQHAYQLEHIEEPVPYDGKEWFVICTTMDTETGEMSQALHSRWVTRGAAELARSRAIYEAAGGVL